MGAANVKINLHLIEHVLKKHKSDILIVLDGCNFKFSAEDAVTKAYILFFLMKSKFVV